MASFSRVDDSEGMQGGSLSQTMTGLHLVPTASSPPPPKGAPGNLTEQQQIVQAWMDQLNATLGKMPDVDIAAKMKPLLEEARAQKVPEKMSPLASALAAFGSPAQSQNIVEHNRGIEKMQQQKDANLMKLQEAIITAEISQLMEEGKFKKALEQSRVLQTMAPVLAAAERSAALDDFERRENIKQKGRIELAEKRGALAKDNLIQRAKLLTKGMSIDERILMAQINNISRLQQIELQRSAVFDPLSQQWTVNPLDMDSIQQQGILQLENWISAQRPVAPAGKTPPAGSKKKPEKAMSAADRIRAAANQ